MGRRTRRVQGLDLNQPKKRQRLPARAQRRLALLLTILWLVGIAATVPAVILFNRLRDAKSAAEHVPEVKGEIRVKGSEVRDGDVRFYVCDGPSAKDARFFVVRRADHTVAVALDASESSSAGFRKRDGRLACNGCSLQFPLEEVAKRTGECYPVPVGHAIRDGDIVIRTDDLRATIGRLKGR